MEKPLYKVGDVLIWHVAYETNDLVYEVVKVRHNSYDLKSLMDDNIYEHHLFEYTHGNCRKATKLDKALK